ncbi:MAG: rod-binding protein [Phycisphaerales bacterium]|jgi:Rod binding domain-containing protein|nr:rod-binding protein [Phycisphaerales bacterium]
MMNITNQINLVAGGGMRRMSALKPADYVPGSKSPESKHEQLTRAAQKWVAQTFYGAMLKQMRNSPFKSELFSGGRGGEAFGSMLDQTLAERMARGTNNKLVRSIVREILHRDEKGINPPPQPSSDNPFAKVRVHVAPTR